MKCYFQYNNKENGDISLSWFLLTSSNLSQAAWGVLQHSGSQLFIKSFELGVLFLPQRYSKQTRSFSCTPSHPILGITKINKVSPSSETVSFVVSSDLNRRADHKQNHVIEFRLPFEVPPPLYSNHEEPWVWD
jgi:tyrosyl-DNA phosphodiesterase 1